MRLRKGRMMLKLVIFDMDGTVCDSYPLMVRAMREAAAVASGEQVSDEAFLDGMTFGAAENGILRRILGDEYADKAAEVYASLYEKYLPIMCPAPFEGIDEIFAFLKEKGIQTALVTGKNRSSCMMTLRQFGMENAFDHVECGSDLGSRKKVGMTAVLDALHISPEEALHIGDAPSDVRYAREVGLLALSALWASNTVAAETLAEKPDGYFYTPQEFISYLEHTLK